jgi:hypothetical protein
MEDQCGLMLALDPEGLSTHLLALRVLRGTLALKALLLRIARAEDTGLYLHLAHWITDCREGLLSIRRRRRELFAVLDRLTDCALELQRGTGTLDGVQMMTAEMVRSFQVWSQSVELSIYRPGEACLGRFALTQLGERVELVLSER